MAELFAPSNFNIHLEAQQFKAQDLQMRRAIQNLEGIERTPLRGGGDSQSIKKATQDFESFFIYYLMKIMRKTVPKTELLYGGRAEEITTAMFDEALGDTLARAGGIGLASMIEAQLRGAYQINRQERGTIYNIAHPLSVGLSPGIHRFLRPVGGRISSGFGWRDSPWEEGREFHQGIDIVAPQGTKILAAEAGKVVFSGGEGGSGNMVIIEHDDGYRTAYAHNLENLVKEGEQVVRGQPVGTVGSTGRTTGAHLHFELWHHGVPLNPQTLIK